MNIDLAGIVIKMQDAREFQSPNGCVPGWKAFIESHGYDFKDVVLNGLTAEQLLATEDIMAIDLVNYVLKGTIMGKDAGGVTLRKYYVSMLQVLCQSPIDYITQVRVDKRVIYSGKFTGGIVTINKPNLFGGMTREGGVSGNIEFQLGLPTQTAATFITNKFGASPAYRRLVTAILENLYIGTNYYMKPISYVVTRLRSTNSGATVWQPSYVEPIPGQMNGVHIIRDLLTDNIYGLGVDVTKIGSSFDTAAVTTFNEGYGFSFFFNQDKTLDELIKIVKAHLNAELYISRITNTYEIKLIRNDYILGSLLTLDSSNSDKVTSLKRTLPGELFSKVVVQYKRLYTLDKAQLNIQTITRSGTTATVTTDRDHGFNTGQKIAIQGSVDPLYNGSFSIIVTSSTTFTYVMTGTPVANATGSLIAFTYTWATDNAIESAEDIALSVRQGGVVQKKIEFEGVRDRFLAKKIALRELAEVATQIWVGTVTCNRTAENLNIGDAFILSSSINKYLDSDIVCRVSTIDLGSSTNNKITINFVQDVFAAEEAPIFITPDSEHQDPITVPVVATSRLLQEVPYYALAKSVGDAQAQSTPTTNSFIMMAAKAPTDDSINAGFWTNGLRNNLLTFSPYGELGTSIDKVTTVLNIINQDNFIQAKVGQVFQIDNEIMGIVSVSGASVTVIRGCADTVPELHSAGAKGYAWQELNGTNKTAFLLTEVVANRLTPITPAGELPFAAAPNDNITIAGRLHLPYPPGNFKINATTWITSVVLADLILTWTSRNRFQQTVTLLDYYAASVTSESGITYSSELRRVDTNAILLSFTGETLLTRTYTTLVNLPGTVTSITFVGTTATVTMSVAHGLITGRQVKIAGATDALYNGNFSITVLTTTTFTYTMLGTPAANASGSLTAKASIFAGNVSLSIWSVNANGISFQKVTHIFNLT